MVKISFRGKGIKHSFREDIGIVGILKREDNVILLGSDGEFGGQGGFSDMLVVKHKGFLYPIITRVVLCQPRHP